MKFIVNDYLTITNFKGLKIYESFMKFGVPYDYEKFSGKIEGTKVTGWICLADDGIYNIKEIK